MPTDNEIRSAYISRFGEPTVGFITALTDAKHKLRVIIDRFGDADGDRLTAEYIAQLVYEEAHAADLEGFTMRVCAIVDDAEKIKEARSSSSYSRPAIIDIIKHLYCSTVAASCQ